MVFKYPKNLTLLSKPRKFPSDWQRVDSKHNDNKTSSTTVNKQINPQTFTRNQTKVSTMAMITKNDNYYGPLDNDFAQQLGTTSPAASSTLAAKQPAIENRRTPRATVTQSPYSGGRIGNRGGRSGGIGLRSYPRDNQQRVQKDGLSQRISTERRNAGRDLDQERITKAHESRIAQQNKDELDAALKSSESMDNDSKIASVDIESDKDTTSGGTGNESEKSMVTDEASTPPVDDNEKTLVDEETSKPPVDDNGEVTLGTDQNEEVVDNTAEDVDMGKLVPMIESKWILEIRPSNTINEFNIEEMLGSLIVAVTSIDSFAYIKSWYDEDAPHINSPAAIPVTDEDMEKYVEDPHTSNAGDHGRFYGRITFMTAIPFEKIKYHQSFNRWVRHVGVFLDKSELTTPRPKSLGFFTYKLAHYNRTNFFAGFLKKLLTLSKPFQIATKPIYVETGNTKKCFCYSIMTASEDVDTTLEEIRRLAANIHLKFYTWDEYKKEDVKIKTKLIDELIQYRAKYGCMIFEGLWANHYMRDGSQPISKKRTSDNSLQTTTMTPEQELDIKYGKVKCLDFIQDYFRHSDGSEIFIQLRGPVDNMIEITFAEADRASAIVVDRIFPSVMAAHMTDESIRNSFFYGDLVKASIGQHEPWVEPVSRYSQVRRGRQLPFAFTKKSTITYLDMVRNGTKKADIPLTLSVTTSTEKPETGSAATTLTTATTQVTTNNNALDAFMKKMEERQVAFEKKCLKQNEDLQKTMKQMKLDTEENAQISKELQVEVDANQEEILDALGQIHKRASRTLYRYVDHRFHHYSSTTNKVLEYMLKRDGVPQDDIDALMQVEMPEFDPQDDEMYDYDEEDPAYDDDANIDDPETENDDENRNPLSDKTEGSTNKSARIASPGGLTDSGQKDDRPADSQMATDTQ